MKKILKFKLLLILLAQANFSLAWNASGHQIMAAITWDLLTHEQQTYWIDILEHHPRFEKDFKDNIPKYVKKHPNTYAQWIFRQAAVWPDFARGFQQKQRDKFHHGPWHYINYPIYLNNKVNTKFLNLDTDWQGKFHNKLNIIQALKGNISTLSKHGASKKEKALALSWVLHLVADSHQPLHSSALFSQTYFPKGDRGGNLTKINGQGRYENLHWYWDSTLDNSTAFKVVDIKAKKLTRKYKKMAIKSNKNSINQWLIKANKITKKHVYTQDLIDKLKQAELNHDQQPIITISNKYNKQARKVAGLQITKAGFQLAEILTVIH